MVTIASAGFSMPAVMPNIMLAGHNKSCASRRNAMPRTRNFRLCIVASLAAARISSPVLSMERNATHRSSSRQAVGSSADSIFPDMTVLAGTAMVTSRH